MRRISDEAGVSTITVYHHLCGVRGLLDEVVIHGYSSLRAALLDAEASDDDPSVQLFAMALATREMARSNPHLYDMMFGLSTRGTYRATPPPTPPQHHFREAYGVLVRACERMKTEKRIDIDDPEEIAAQLWSLVHGFVSLEAGGHFDVHEDPATSVLAPMAVAQLVGNGENRLRATDVHKPHTCGGELSTGIERRYRPHGRTYRRRSGGSRCDEQDAGRCSAGSDGLCFADQCCCYPERVVVVQHHRRLAVRLVDWLGLR